MTTVKYMLYLSQSERPNYTMLIELSAQLTFISMSICSSTRGLVPLKWKYNIFYFIVNLLFVMLLVFYIFILNRAVIT